MRPAASLSPGPHKTSAAAQAHIEALLDWWSLAGVDACVTDAGTDWFASARPAAFSMHQPVHAAAVGTPLSGPALDIGFPNTISAFHDFLAGDTGLPERDWIGQLVLPRGPVAPRLMVILDMPEQDNGPDSVSGYLSDDADRLLINMLRALGLGTDQVYIAALAVRRPPGGILPPSAGPRLAMRMKHHMGLVAPRAALLLGDATNRFLNTTDMGLAPSALRNINHESGTIEAVATFHPRFMLRQPMAKAECWRAVQQLIGKWHQ